MEFLPDWRALGAKPVIKLSEINRRCRESVLLTLAQLVGRLSRECSGVRAIMWGLCYFLGCEENIYFYIYLL